MTQEYRWINELSKQFLEKDYLIENQTIDERVTEIANAAEKILNKPGFANKFKEYVKKGWYSLSTPIWTNFGTNRGLGISCFSSYIDDTMESILSTQAEVGMMTKYGGGTSAYFGNLRPRGSSIKQNGESSGSVHFMQLFDNIINIVSQGKTRRGNFAAYLPIDHKDINEFLTIRSEGSPLQDISFGVCVPDYWMEEMINGDEEKRKTWAKVLQSRSSTGYPYILFSDTANKNAPDVYKDKNLKIYSSNLCVAGDQRVVSNRGLKTAKELYEEGGDLILFDNDKKVVASPMQLIEKDADVYTITLSNGMKHTVTGYHKIKIRDNSDKRLNRTLDVECSNLKEGDFVAIQTNEGIFGNIDNKDEAFLLGMYHGDGTQTDKLVCLDLWEHDFDLAEEIENKTKNICIKYNTQLSSNGRTYNIPKFSKAILPKNKNVSKKRLASAGLKKIGFKKGIIPDWLWQSNKDTQWEYIRGLFYTDGTVRIGKSGGNPLQLSLANIDRKFLEQVQIILSNLGMQTSIRMLRKEGYTDFGDKNQYFSKDCWRLIIGNKNDALIFNKHTKFLDRKGVKLENREYRDNTKKFSKIVNISYSGKQDVYCCKVNSDNHHWICNGFITHNCSEILLNSNINESFVCDLSSMNILYYDEWKNTDAVETLVYFLDAVMTEFIEKASKIPFMERSVNFAKNQRALGIGWIGWHSYLQSKMVAFESLQAKFLNTEIAENIKNSAYKASEKLAKEYGEPPLLKGYGRRNVTLLAIAPTKSSAFIMGQMSEAVEPEKSNYYIKDLAKGKFTVKNKYLEKLLIEKNKNTEKVWNDILKHAGSVQHLDFLTQEEKDVFKTFAEISQKEIIIQAAQRQKYIDQSQSLNLMIHPSIPIKDVNALIIDAWKMGVKTLYYQFSVNAAQEFARNILNCSNCES